jgi:transposase
MTNKEFPSFPISKKEIAAALAAELRPWVRKRLVAIHAVIEGRNLTDAAAATGTSAAGVCKWLRQARQDGCAALLRDGRAERHHLPLMTPEQVTTFRHEIEAALAGPLAGPQRQRLAAIQLALSGQFADAAAAAHVKPRTVAGWLFTLRRYGITPFLPKDRRAALHVRADVDQLHALAAAEKNPNIRKRILALSYVALGVPIYDAAIAARVSTRTVYTAMRRFQREGIAAFRNKPCPGGRVRLAPGQLRAVAGIVRDDPAITPGELRARIRAEFDVHYTPAGLKNMLKKQLGIFHTAAASRPANSSQTKA